MPVDRVREPIGRTVESAGLDGLAIVRIQRRGDRADRGGARRTERPAEQQCAVAAHRPTDETHPGGVQALGRQHRQQLHEHHQPRVLAGHPPVPPAVAAVDRDHRERRATGLDRLGQARSTPMPTTPDASMSRPCSAITGCNSQTAPAAWRCPLRFDPTAGGRDERAGRVRRQRLGRRGRRLSAARAPAAGEPRLPDRIERAHTATRRQPRTVGASARRRAWSAEASQLGGARSREPQSTCWFSRLPFWEPAPLPHSAGVAPTPWPTPAAVQQRGVVGAGPRNRS